MKYLAIVLMFCTVLFAQSSEKTVVYGTVITSVKDFKPFSYSGIMYDEYKDNKSYMSSSISVDVKGFFSSKFPKDTKLKLSTYYSNYYTADTIIETRKNDSIRIDFFIRPKIYTYTEQKAEKDIKDGLVQLITFDSLIYDWDKKVNFTKAFDFKYLYAVKPEDREFENKIEEYNMSVEKHLFAKDSTWALRLNIIKDSLINIKADNYGKTHTFNLSKLKFPADNKLPKKMTNKITVLKRDFEWLNLKKEESSKFTALQMLDKIDRDKEYHYMFVAEYWMAYNYKEMIPELIKRLTNKHEVGLINTADLIISERIQSGDLKFYGHGGCAADDLFTVAGRANHLLTRVTGEYFGYVSMYSTPQDLKKLQNRWAYWLMQLNK